MIDEDKLKSKIEGLKSNLIHGACSSQIAMETCCKEEAYNEVISLLDSLQEEPVSEDLEVELNKYIKDHFTIDKEQLDRFGIEEKDYMYSMDRSDMLALVEHFTNWQKTKEGSVSEDLEEAAENHAVERYKATRDMVLAEKCKWSFKAGAKWQKEQDKQWLAEEHKHIFAKGRESMKQQMMKDTVDGLVYAQLTTSGEIMIRSNYFKSETLDYLDNVKLIIIKEDKV
jgi:hypothetical protein